MAPLTADSIDWRTRGNCTSFDPDEFMPTGTHGRYRNDVKRACETCPVREKCLQAAIDSPWPPYGLWAGLASRDLIQMWANNHPNYRTRMAELGVPTLDDQEDA